MNPLETTAYFKDGKPPLLIRNRKQIEQDALNSGLKEFEVIIRKKKKNRSLEQNRWLWACMTLLSEHTGYTKDEMLSIVKFKFLKATKADEDSGEVFEYLKGTSELSTTEFSVFMDDLIKWSAESLQVVLPIPNEQTKLELQTK